MTEAPADGIAAGRCAEGDTEAFEVLVDRYQRPVFAAIFHMVGSYEDARELTQQVFMKAFEHIRSFDPSRKFFSWIYRIAMNEAINHLRTRREHATLETEGLTQQLATVEPSGALVTTRAVRQAVLSLSPEQRSVIVLRHFLDCSYRETADVLHIPEKTVKSRLFDARQHLRAALAPATEIRTRSLG